MSPIKHDLLKIMIQLEIQKISFLVRDLCSDSTNTMLAI